MNVIIANKFKDALSNLDIDVIKRLDGEFDVDTIIDTFANFYFNRMILDITALKDSFNISTIQKLSASLDASKIILFLSDDPRINNAYLSNVISLGIYNFTRDMAGVTYLMDNPNSYRDVAQYHELANKDANELKASRGLGGFAESFKNQNATREPEPVQVQNIAPTNTFEAPTPQENNSFFGGGFSGGMDNTSYNNYGTSSTRVIGFKDLTDDAGSTTLVYMLKKNLSRSHKVLAVEINDNDFRFFRDSELMSVAANQIQSVRNRFSQFDIVLIDLNNSDLDRDGTCTDVVYLLEPSTIKLNGLISKDQHVLERLKDKKIVLNKSLLSVSDLKEFEYEAHAKMFYNIPPLDERKDSQMVLDSFLEKLGIYTSESDGNQGGLFGIFKR